MEDNIKISDVLEEFCTLDDEPFSWEKRKYLIYDFYFLCTKDKGKCRPSYHDIANFVIRHRQEDIIPYTIEALETIKVEIEGQCQKLEDYFLKVIDHIKLEQLRLDSVREDLKNQFREKEQQVNDLDKQFKKSELQVKNLDEHISLTEDTVKRVHSKLTNHKFDLIALTTLIFSAFTMLQINVTLFSACANASYPLNQIVLLMTMVNIITVTSIMAIYSVIRKIHGDIDDEKLYSNLFILFLILIFLGIVGYFVL